MSQKSISFSRPKAKTGVDDWINAQSKTKTLTKRISVDLTEDEHRGLKAKCAQERYKITDLLRLWINDFVEQKT